MHSLLPPYYRCKKLHLRALFSLHKEVYHFVHGLLLNLSSTLRTMGHSHSGKEKTHIVVDFRDGSHCRTRVSICGLLVNGNRGRKSFYELHIRLFHLPEELPCVRGKRLHIASLSLRINGIEGERGLSGARESCKHHQRISWNIQIDML